MGKTFSAPLPKPTSKCPYFVIVLRPPKSFVLIFADEAVRKIISTRLKQSWPLGLKNGDVQGGLAMSDGSYQFLLKGSPFSIKTNSDGILKLNSLFCNLLIDLKLIGWRLMQSTKDLSQPTPNSGCSTLFFCQVDKSEIDFVEVANESEIICVCTAGVGEPSNLLRVINAPMKLVTDLACYVEPSGTCKLIETGKYDREVKDKSNNVCTLRMDELLWGECDTLYSRRFILKTFNHLHTFGYRFYGAINYDGASDIVFFERSPSLVLTPHNIVPDQQQAIIEEEEDEEEEELDKELDKNEIDPVDLVGRVKEEIDTLDEDADLESRSRAFSLSHASGSSSSTSTASTNSSSSSTMRYFILDAYKTNNRLRVIKAPLRIVFVLRSIISLRWPFGLRSMTRLDLDAYEFVAGIDTAKDANRANVGGNSVTLFCHIFQTLRQHGWHLAASLDLCHNGDKWTFVFQEMGWVTENKIMGGDAKSRLSINQRDCIPMLKQLVDTRRRSTSISLRGRVWCICISGPSTITIVNGRQDLKQTICELIDRYWPRGAKNVVEFGGNRRIRLVGQPWIPVHSGFVDPSQPSEHQQNEDLLARSLLCIVLSELVQNFNCQPLCVSAVTWKSGANDRNQISDAHCCWYFIDPQTDEAEDEEVTNGTTAAIGISNDSSFKRRSTM